MGGRWWLGARPGGAVGEEACWLPYRRSQTLRPRCSATGRVSHSTPRSSPTATKLALAPTLQSLPHPSLYRLSSHSARATSRTLEGHLARHPFYRTQHRSPHTSRHGPLPLQPPYRPSTPHESSCVHHCQHKTLYTESTPRLQRLHAEYLSPGHNPDPFPVEVVQYSALPAMHKKHM